MDCLNFECRLNEFPQDGRDVWKLRGVHGGPPTQFHGVAFAVLGDSEMCAQVFQRGFGSRKAGGMGLVHEAVQTRTLVCWSSRLMVGVAPDIKSMAAAGCVAA